MADNRLELVVEVDTNRANASIKSVNASLSSMEASAVKTARGAAQGIDGMTAAMVKGATAGNLLADAIKTALTWAKEHRRLGHDGRRERRPTQEVRRGSAVGVCSAGYLRPGRQDHGAREVDRRAPSREPSPVRTAGGGRGARWRPHLLSLEGRPGTASGPLRQDAAEGAARSASERQDQR